MSESSVERVVLYSRVSTERQATDGHGLDAQRHRLDAFAAERGWEVIEHVADAGVSGKTLDRPGLRRVLDLAASGEVDALVVTKADRLSRSLLDLLRVSATLLDEHGVALVTADEQIDGTTPMGRAAFQMRGIFCELERGLIAARTKEGLAAARAKGKRLGRPPVGWRIDAGRWHRTDRYPVVQLAHSLRGGGLTLQAIADHLTANDIPNGGAFGSWGPSAVRRLLAAPLEAPEAATA